MAKTTTRDTLARAFEEDVTKAPQATTQQDVEGQDARTRLWQSLDQTYGQQRQQIDKNYAQAISQTDRAMQNRGMQRSSYAMQTLANLGQEQAKANADSMASQIADYQNRLSSLETQERQFAYQQERDKVADQQWQQQFQAAQDQWKQQFEYNQMSAKQQLAFTSLMNMMEPGDNPSDALLKQAGISRSDYEQMKASAAAKGKSGRGGGRGGSNGAGGDGGLGGNQSNDPWGDVLLGIANYNVRPSALGIVTGGVGISQANQNAKNAYDKKYLFQQSKTKDRM